MLSATSIEFMLATLAPPFSRQGWWFEMKYDGYRVLCEKTRAGVLVLSRRKYNATGWFPEVVDVLAGLPGHFILDAEACVVDKRGVPHFERLRKRAALKGWKRGADLVQLFAFDLLALVPRPRLHLIRFHGVLAPHAKLRPQIIPSPPANVVDSPPGHSETLHPSASARLSWAQLLTIRAPQFSSETSRH